MDNIKKVKIIGAIVTITGLIVLIGWIFDISIFKSILPQWVAMKVLTAVSFILCGIMLYVIARYAAGDIVSVQVVVPLTAVIIIIVMGTLIISGVMGINLGIEDYFVKETKLAPFDTKPGMPSMGTMFAFILTAVAGALTVLHPVNLKGRFVYFGAAVGILGCIPIIGYMISVPLLTYFMKDVSTAMAFHTAILFVMIGAAFILLSQTADKFSAVRYLSGTRISIGYSVALGIIIILGAASLMSNADFTDAVASQSHSQNIIKSLDNVDMILKNAERVQTNFLLTGKERYLEEYDESLASMKKELGTLRELTKNDPAYQKRLDDLEILVKEEIVLLDTGISIKKDGGLEKAVAFISDSRAAALVEEIKKMINDMQNDEQKLLDKRLGEITTASKKNTGVVIYGLLASLVCFTFFGFLLVRNLSIPLREITNIAGRVAEGDLSGSVLSAGISERQDEVGVLAKSFISMNEYIIGIAKAAERIASQDMSQAIKPKSDKDILGTAFAKMQENLRINTQEKDKATAEMKAVSAYGRSLIEASLDPLVTISKEGKITDVNKSTEQVTGVTRERLVGSDFSDYFTESDKAREGYLQVFSKGFVKDYSLAIRHCSGKVTDVLYNAVVYKNEAGEVQGVFAAARDITENKKMNEKLKEQVREIMEASNVLASSASEILATTTQLASTASETATAVSETGSTAEELKKTAQLSSEKAQSVSESAKKAAAIAQPGKTAVGQTIEGMNRIKIQTDSVAQSIAKLSDKNQAIGDIITTVNDLAEQSNLLAVNAAIEAAKAGEQGKGFTVVAQEIKNLAEQSKHATAQVRLILSDIQKATDSAVMATEQVSKVVDAGVKQSNEAGESIVKLADSISEAAQAGAQIVASSQQQSVGITQIVLAMENIKQAAQQNVVGAKQAERAAQDLNDLGQKLKAMVEVK